MMEHIRQFDWCGTHSDPVNFLEEDDLDNCVTEKILRNKFFDPSISSSEDESAQPKIDWNEVFKKRYKEEDKLRRIYVPGLKLSPQYPKLSALNGKQHYMCLKVISENYPSVLEAVYIPRPTKTDRKVFEEFKSIYENEQQEFLEWAKTLWTNGHCIRALRPKPLIETVYEAEFKERAGRMHSFPKVYEVAAQIPLDIKTQKFSLKLKKELINIKETDLPVIRCPDIIERQFNVMEPCAVPEVCERHPYRFILPYEKSMTILPLTEINRELAQYAYENDAQYIASENSLKCLLELDRDWTIYLSVCDVIGADGDKTNVTVLGSEFSVLREPARTRTYRAYRHLVRNALIPSSEKYKLLNKSSEEPDEIQNQTLLQAVNSFENDLDMTSDEEDNLVIDTEDDQMESQTQEKQQKPENECIDETEVSKTVDKKQDLENCAAAPVRLYSCNCKDTLFDKPAPRSFKKWQVKDLETNEKHDLIVHCTHKIRDESGEVILEPIPEYQIDLAGSKQSEDKIKSLALSLLLRPNASLINVRVECGTGEVVTLERAYRDELAVPREAEVAGALCAALTQLQGLVPGHYVLRHEPMHGANAILYAPRDTGAAQQLRLQFDPGQLADADETKSLKTPPTLCPVLLPSHKFRKILPCAFTPHESQLAREPKKPVARQKQPPQAIKWPKKSRRGRKNKNAQKDCLNSI